MLSILHLDTANRGAGFLIEGGQFTVRFGQDAQQLAKNIGKLAVVAARISCHLAVAAAFWPATLGGVVYRMVNRNALHQVNQLTSRNWTRLCRTAEGLRSDVLLTCLVAVAAIPYGLALGVYLALSLHAFRVGIRLAHQCSYR